MIFKQPQPVIISSEHLKDEDGSEITVGDCLEDLASDIDELYIHFNCDEGRE